MAPPAPPAPARPAPLAPSATPAPAAAAAARAAAAAPESLESRIGGRWLLNIGIAAIVIGVAYFQKWAIDYNWITPTMRVIQGAIAGAVMIVAGGRFARRGYDFYGQMIAGGGVAVLYVSTYAAFNYYQLIERPTAFVLLAAISALGAWLADRHESQGLAVCSVTGGFVTPFLLAGNTDAQVALFTYDAILVAGTMFLAGRRDWPSLHVVSYVLTLVTIAGWADRYYVPSRYPHYLRTELFFTLFCAMFVTIAVRMRRSESPLAQAAAVLLWTAPVAYYLASLVVLAPHPTAMLVWLIAVTITGAVASARVATWIGLAISAAVAVPLLGWTQTYGGPAWVTPGLATIAGIYVIALAAQFRVMGAADRMRPAEIAWLHLNALSAFAACYLLLEDTHIAVTGPLAAAFAAWNGVLAAAVLKHDREYALHFAALAFSLLSVAVALQFDGPAVTVGWAAEGAAVVALGLHERREWLRLSGAALFTLAVVRTLELLTTGPAANHMVVLNPRAACAAVVIGLSYLIAWLHRRYQEPEARDWGVGSGILVAQLLTVSLLTSEIYAFFEVRNSPFTREVMTSVTWAAYATALIVVGLYRRYVPIRYFGIGLFAITILKVFFGDLAHLQQIYRVLSVMGLGLLLLLTSWLYQRMRGALLRPEGDPEPRSGRQG